MRLIRELAMRGSAHRRSQSTSALARSQPPSPPMANGRGPPRDQEDEAARNYFSGAGALRRTSSRASNEAVDDRGGDSSDGSLASVKPSKQRRFTRAGSKSSLLPTHSGGADDFLGCQVRFRLPGNAQLCRIFFAMTAMIVLFNAASWGMGDMYGARLPHTTGRYAPSHDLHRLYERSTLASTQASLHRPGTSGEGIISGGGAPMPLMIPRIIHQTYKTSDVPDRVKGLMRTWADKNPGWKTRFYNDQECYKFVEREFPEYYDAYVSLPKDVERSDFFRYLIVLHSGGLYADIDTECRQPMDSYLRSTDTLVVGWENEFRTDEMAYSRHFVRRRQVLNWVFAGAPGHPALREICDHIARSAHRVFTNNTNRDTLERTGPGAFTDVIVRQFWLHSKTSRAAKDVLAPLATSAWGTEDTPETQARREEEKLLHNSKSLHDSAVAGARGRAGDAWNVRVMPKVSFGVHPTGDDGVPFDDPGVLVAHHFLGSWKSRKGWNSAKKGVGDYVTLFLTSLGLGKSGLEEYRAQLSRADPFYAMPTVNERAGYPVSAAFDPPFDMLTHLSGSNASEGVVDASGSSLTKWGGWQAGRYEPRAPTSAEALVGSLSARDSPRGGVLVDVGAGLGFFSLAAAARGHPAIAFEWGGGDELFRASVAHNGFGKLVDVRTVRVGGRGEEYCRAIARAETAARKALAGPRGRGARANAAKRSGGGAPVEVTDVDQTLLGVSNGALERTRERLAEADATRVDTNMDAGVDGYAHDDEGERDDGVRRRGRRALLRRGPARAGVSVHVPAPRVPVHLTRDAITTRGDSPFACEIADEAGITSIDEEIEKSNVVVSAMRIGFGDGWERHILEGARRLLTASAPPIVLVEVSPRNRIAFGPQDEHVATHAALDWLWQLGYTDVAHSGTVCEERWRNITKHVDTRGGAVHGVDGREMKQPTWCHASRADLHALAHRSGTEPESVLLHRVVSGGKEKPETAKTVDIAADLLPADADVDR